jgi:site-specific DNA-methyltransferase (adenine-specific)
VINLILGDCLEKLKELPDSSIDMVLTDTPYGTTACKWDTVIPFEPMWKELKRIRKENSAICLFGSEPFSSALRMSNIKEFKYDWVWEKQTPTGFLDARRKPMKSHELIHIFAYKQTRYNPQGLKPVNIPAKGKKGGQVYGNCIGDGYIQKEGNFPRSVLKFNKERGQHPTQKPVALLEYLIKTYTNEGDTVLDFTMGSGSTGVAAKNLNRKFIGIELNEEYFEIAKNRINRLQLELSE